MVRAEAIESSNIEPALFRLEQVTYSTGERTIIAPLSLELAPGRIYGLIGANGSGKSTLVKLLARQRRATDGGLRLNGRNIADFPERELARTLAYMPQFMPPAEGMTVAELVGLGRFPWHGVLGRFTENDRTKVADALAQTDLTKFADRLVDSLSGGERQRAWLAMMLAQDTTCLLLDEPTSALDIAHQVEILALIRTLSRERGTGVVVVLHDVNLAARYCDEILALAGGRLVAKGTPDVIQTPETLATIFGLAMGVLPNPATGQAISYPL